MIKICLLTEHFLCQAKVFFKNEVVLNMIAVRGCQRHELLKYLAQALGQALSKQNYTAAYYSQIIPPIKYFLEYL